MPIFALLLLTKDVLYLLSHNSKFTVVFAAAGFVKTPSTVKAISLYTKAAEKSNVLAYI